MEKRTFKKTHVGNHQVFDLLDNHDDDGDDTFFSSSFDKTIVWWKYDGTRLGKYRGHISPVYAIVKLSSKVIASGSYDGSIKTWDIRSQECLETFRDSTCLSMIKLKFNNGRTLACGGQFDGSIKLLSARLTTNAHLERINGRSLTTLKGHADRVVALCEMGNGRLASGSNDKTLRVWNLTTNNCILSLREPDSIAGVVEVFRGILAWYPNIASPSVKLWDVDDGRCVGRFAEKVRIQLCLKVKHTSITSIDNPTLCIFSNNGTIQLWKAKSGEHVGVFNTSKDVCKMLELKNGTIVLGLKCGGIEIVRLACSLVELCCRSIARLMTSCDDDDDDEERSLRETEKKVLATGLPPELTSIIFAYETMYSSPHLL